MGQKNILLELKGKCDKKKHWLIWTLKWCLNTAVISLLDNSGAKIIQITNISCKIVYCYKNHVLYKINILFTIHVHVHVHVMYTSMYMNNVYLLSIVTIVAGVIITLEALGATQLIMKYSSGSAALSSSIVILTHIELFGGWNVNVVGVSE